MFKQKCKNKTDKPWETKTAEAVILIPMVN